MKPTGPRPRVTHGTVMSSSPTVACQPPHAFQDIQHFPPTVYTRKKASLQWTSRPFFEPFTVLPLRPSRKRMAYQQTTFGKRAFHKTSLSFLLLAAGALLLLVGPGGASAAACYRALPRSAFPHCQLLSPTFALHWRVDSDLASGNITLGLDADTGGYPDSWLAIALSDAGGMHGADMMLVAGGTAAAGGAAWRALDLHSLDFVQPQMDEHQDVSLVGTPVSGDNTTVAVIIRKLRTCDVWDRAIQIGVPQAVSWAYGRRWPSKHLARGDSAVFFVPEADSLWGMGGANATNATANATAANGTTAPRVTGTVGPTEGQGQQQQQGGTAGAIGSVSREALQRLFSSASASTTNATTTTTTTNNGIRNATNTPMGGDVDGGGGEGVFIGGAAGGAAPTGGAGGGAADQDVRELQVVMPNITVPDNATTNYMCIRMTLPHDRKYHIVADQAIVHSPLIHHMILFACDSAKAAAAIPEGQLYGCLGIGGGPGCNTFYIGWAPGTMGGALPPSVGLPIGESDSTHFALQVHYENVDALSGIVDASGFKIRYTPRLRQYDAGVLTLGQQAIAIPPGEPIFTLQPNVCPSTCTAKLDTPLRLLSSTLHAHTLGRAIVTQHIRAGVELPPIGARQFYDFNYQSPDPVPLDSSILMPGDVLITTCSYDSTSRTNVTTFGEGTKDEMCFNFVLYYPKDRSFEICTSMDAAGDNSTALCGSFNQTQPIAQVLQQLAANASSSSKATSVAAGAGAGNATAAIRPPRAANLSSVPALAPYFASGVLQRVPPSDATGYKPYGRECPDMSYGMPFLQQRELVLQALSA